VLPLTLDISMYPEAVQDSLRAFGAADASGVRRAHGFTGKVADGSYAPRTREQREEAMDVLLAPYAGSGRGATLRARWGGPEASGSGHPGSAGTRSS
jgi:hypothetical protein